MLEFVLAGGRPVPAVEPCDHSGEVTGVPCAVLAGVPVDPLTGPTRRLCSHGLANGPRRPVRHVRPEQTQAAEHSQHLADLAGIRQRRVVRARSA